MQPGWRTQLWRLERGRAGCQGWGIVKCPGNILCRENLWAAFPQTGSPMPATERTETPGDGPAWRSLRTNLSLSPPPPTAPMALGECWPWRASRSPGSPASFPAPGSSRALLGRSHQPSVLGLPLDLSPSPIPCPAPPSRPPGSTAAEDRGDRPTPLSLQDSAREGPQPPSPASLSFYVCLCLSRVP